MEKESSTERSSMEFNYCGGKFSGGIDNATVGNIEATHGLTQFMPRWQTPGLENEHTRLVQAKTGHAIFMSAKALVRALMVGDELEAFIQRMA